MSGEPIELAELAAGRWTRIHRGRNFTKADVHLVEAGGRRLAVKDYRDRGLVGRLLGRWSLAREARAYAALSGVGGVPALAGRPEPLVLVTAYIDGTSLAGWERGRSLGDTFFPRLQKLLGAVHGSGVVQGDLHHRDVLVATDGAPWLVDFSTSLTRGPTGGPLRRWLWRLLARLDRGAILKLQARFAPGTLTADEQQELVRRPAVYRAVRALRGLLRRRVRS